MRICARQLARIKKSALQIAVGYEVFTTRHPQERQQIERRRRARDKQGEKRAGRDEVREAVARSGAASAWKGERGTECNSES